LEGLEGAARVLKAARLAILTGAGVSTDSGIPDYRSPGRPPRRSIQHQEFVNSETWRRRYWARSTVGWPHFSKARPSEVHHAIARLPARTLITQNVDRLHQQAGSSGVIELHGALAEVKCLGCGELSSRGALQQRLLAANPTLDAETAESRPDGDAELESNVIERFVVVDCQACAGVLMPNVVFFGGSVDKAIVDASYASVDEADALLVLGTSLTVFSGYRFVRRASDGGKPVVIINRGPTRGDPLATHRVDAPLAEVLPALLARLER